MNYYDYIQSLGYTTYPAMYNSTYQNYKRNKTEVHEEHIEDVKEKIEEQVEGINNVVEEPICEFESCEDTSRAIHHQSKMGNDMRKVAEDIRNAVQNIHRNYAFFDHILSRVPNEIQGKMIQGVKDTLRNNEMMLREIYHAITRTKLPESFEIPPQNFSNMSFIQSLEKAFIDTHEAISMYLMILHGLESMRHQNMMIEIIVNELKHASKFNYLITKNYI